MSKEFKFMAPRYMEWLTFVRETLSRPSAIGAVCPTSSHSSKIIAEQVPQHQPGLIIELGAGTGVVTQELLRAGIAPERLVVVENSPKFYKILVRRFPNLKIINGDAAQLDHLLGEQKPLVSTVVSAVPIRSLPPTVSKAICEQIMHLLPPTGTYIQLTYSWSKTHESIPQGLKYHSSKFLWLNFPPARIDIFKREKM